MVTNIFLVSQSFFVVVRFIIGRTNKYLRAERMHSVFMRFGGTCPLLKLRNKNEFMRLQIESFYNRKISMNTKELKKEFCSNVCKNIFC